MEQKPDPTSVYDEYDLTRQFLFDFILLVLNYVGEWDDFETSYGLDHSPVPYSPSTTNSFQIKRRRTRDELRQFQDLILEHARLSVAEWGSS